MLGSDNTIDLSKINYSVSTVTIPIKPPHWYNSWSEDEVEIPSTDQGKLNLIINIKKNLHLINRLISCYDVLIWGVAAAGTAALATSDVVRGSVNAAYDPNSTTTNTNSTLISNGANTTSTSNTQETTDFSNVTFSLVMDLIMGSVPIAATLTSGYLVVLRNLLRDIKKHALESVAILENKMAQTYFNNQEQFADQNDAIIRLLHEDPIVKAAYIAFVENIHRAAQVPQNTVAFIYTVISRIQLFRPQALPASSQAVPDNIPLPQPQHNSSSNSGGNAQTVTSIFTVLPRDEENPNSPVQTQGLHHRSLSNSSQPH